MNTHLMNKPLVLISLLTCLAIQNVTAQLARNELSVGAELSFPVDDYKWIFDPGLLYHISYASSKKPKGNITDWFVYRLAYGQQRPVADTLFYLVSDTEYGSIVYSKRQLLIFTVGKRWDFASNNKIRPFIGLDIGGFMDYYSTVQDDPGFDFEGGSTDQGILLSPLGGLRFVSDNGFGVFVQGRYAFSLSLSEQYHQMSFGAGVSYTF